MPYYGTAAPGAGAALPMVGGAAATAPPATLDQLNNTSLFSSMFSKPAVNTAPSSIPGIASVPGTYPQSTFVPPGAASSTAGVLPLGTSTVAGDASVAPGGAQQQQQQQKVDPFQPPAQKVESNFWMARQQEYLANQKKLAAASLSEVSVLLAVNPDSVTAIKSEEIKTDEQKDALVIGNLQPQQLETLPILKKEELAKRISPYKLIPELHVRTEHAKYIVTMASQDPQILTGWQVQLI